MRRLVPVSVLALLVACGTADVEPSVPESWPEGWTVIDSPTGWGNLAMSCIDGVRIFISSDDVRSSSAVAAVVDPDCVQGEP